MQWPSSLTLHSMAYKSIVLKKNQVCFVHFEWFHKVSWRLMKNLFIFEPLSTDFRFCIQHEYLYIKEVSTSFSNGESRSCKVRMVITEFLLSWAHCNTSVSLRFVFHCNTCRINQKNILPCAPVNVWACSFELIMEPLSWYLITYCINVKVIHIARHETLKFT